MQLTLQNTVNMHVITPLMLQQGRIKAHKYMTPSAYCEKWIPRFYNLMPTDTGYKKACIQELQRVLGYTESAIYRWGADFSQHPPQVSYTLKWVDLANNFYWLLGFKANEV